MYVYIYIYIPIIRPEDSKARLQRNASSDDVTTFNPAAPAASPPATFVKHLQHTNFFSFYNTPKF